ncbi:MAG: 50S ribosomal protein L32 [Lentisphaerae bacterium]|jgi:large subunit ribosomal protein L32|nr:50S ribosomal protein L32 [Lentisphaerota bacterium]
MAVPKRKKSKMRVRQRRAHFKAKIAEVATCPNCNASHRSHRVCTSCGYYNGRQVLSIKVAE